MTTLYIAKTGYTPLRESPLVGKKLADIPYLARVELGKSPARPIYPEGGTTTVPPPIFIEVVYRPNEKQTLTGWIYSGFVDEYHTEYEPGVVEINTGTLNPYDAEQYIIWQKQVQYNLCGPLSVLYCTGWDLEIAEYLDLLKAAASTAGKIKEFFLRVFPQFRSRGTTPYDLDVMLSLYDGYKPSVTLEEALFDDMAGKPIVSPGRYAKILQESNIISSCHIDSQTGRLRGSGVLHWVVLEEVKPDRAGLGWVLLYNPFTNSMERYSWSEFIASAGQPYGILVERGEG